MLEKKHAGQLTNITPGEIYFATLHKVVSFPPHLVNTCATIYFHPENNRKSLKLELEIFFQIN